MITARSLLAGVGAVSLAFVLILGAVVFVAVDRSAASPTGGSLNDTAIPTSAQAYIPWLEQAGTLCPEVTAPLLAAQIDQESGWNPAAVSPTGALGLAQFLPTTWPTWARNDDGTGQVSPDNPADAIMAEGRYLCALAAQMAGLAAQTGIGVVSLALAAYNAGPGAVLAAHGIPANGQTPDYVTAILAKEATYTLELVSDAGGSPLGLAIVAAAETQLGVAYVWGGGNDSGPTSGQPGDPGGHPVTGQVGFDCSGLVLFAVYQASRGTLALPHSSEIQATLGQAVPAADIAPGDVIAYALSGGGDFDHIGIYIGDGQMIDAPYTGVDVRIEPVITGVPVAIRNFG